MPIKKAPSVRSALEAPMEDFDPYDTTQVQSFIAERFPGSDITEQHQVKKDADHMHHCTLACSAMPLPSNILYLTPSIMVFV